MYPSLAKLKSHGVEDSLEPELIQPRSLSARMAGLGYHRLVP